MAPSRTATRPLAGGGTPRRRGTHEKTKDVEETAALEEALRRAAPHTLLDVVRTALARRYGARRVGLWLVDHGMRSLQAVGAPPGAAPGRVPVHGSPQGRAFGAQEPYLLGDEEKGPVEAHLPVTVRGDRLGVLSLELPRRGGARLALPELRRVCDALGHEILVAERDTDLYVLARRATRLTLAAEMQWQLLPGRSCARPEFSIGAQLEPAYAVFGDTYDWSVSADHLTLTVANGMGEGMDAALLTNLAVNALRNARRAGLDLAGQAALADQAVYAQYRGSAHVAVLLLRFALATGEVEVVDAGSPRLWRLRGGAVEAHPFEAQLPWACSRTRCTYPSASPSSPATGCCSPATACTTPSPAPVSGTGRRPCSAPSPPRACCRPPRSRTPCCGAWPNTTAGRPRRTTPSCCASTGTGGRAAGRPPADPVADPARPARPRGPGSRPAPSARAGAHRPGPGPVLPGKRIPASGARRGPVVLRLFP